MERITPEEKKMALRIAGAIDDYFKSTGKTDERSTDLFYYLANKKIVEWDRHQGLHFRKFLYKLKRSGSLDLIPQCKPIKGYGDTTEWHFYAVKSQIQGRKLRPVTLKPDDPIDEEACRLIVASFPTERDELAPEYEEVKLIKYKRAWCKWTKDEEDLLKALYSKTKNISRLAMLLQRQESAVENRLKSIIGDGV